MKKFFKFLGKLTLFESIMGYVVIFILIAGVVGIIALTNYNPYISAPLCILYVFVVMILYWKIEKSVSDYFNKNND